jgi:pyruvate/oxaloacetate carboxyltransferase
MTQLKNLGLTREQLSREDLDILVEQIGQAVSELIGDVKSKNILEKMNSVLHNGDT